MMMRQRTLTTSRHQGDETILAGLKKKEISRGAGIGATNKTHKTPYGHGAVDNNTSHGYLDKICANGRYSGKAENERRYS